MFFFADHPTMFFYIEDMQIFNIIIIFIFLVFNENHQSISKGRQLQASNGVFKFKSSFLLPFGMKSTRIFSIYIEGSFIMCNNYDFIIAKYVINPAKTFIFILPITKLKLFTQVNGAQCLHQPIFIS